MDSRTESSGENRCITGFSCHEKKGESREVKWDKGLNGTTARTGVVQVNFSGRLRAGKLGPEFPLCVYLSACVCDSFH